MYYSNLELAAMFPFGLKQFRVIPFGLVNAPATFSFCMVLLETHPIKIRYRSLEEWKVINSKKVLGEGRTVDMVTPLGYVHLLGKP
jgi:hypothetical protein